MTNPLVSEVEQFLFYEARLLDTRQFMEWANLFTDDAVYQVPPTNVPDADPMTALYLINDDRHRITERAKRLLKKAAHAEYPASRTVRQITNVSAQEDAGVVDAACVFVCYRSRMGRMDIFPGHSRYRFRRGESQQLMIQTKHATLAIESLRPQGKLSILL